MTDNFQHLVNANLDVLRARACQVLDMRLLDTEEPPEFRWGVDLPASEIPPALTLRGRGFHAFATQNRKEIGPRLKKPSHGVSVHDYIERSQNASVAAVNVSVGGKRIVLSDDSGSTDSKFIETATTGLPSAVVDRATVSTPTGRITVDFPHGTGIGVTRSDTLLAHILQTTTTLLVPMEPNAKERLDEFLAVAPQEGTLDVDESGQFPIDELDDDEDSSLHQL